MIDYDRQAMFIASFDWLAEKSEEGLEKRKVEWEGVDPNGNGHASFAEVDLWIKRMLIRQDQKTKPYQNRADEVWKAYRAVYILAFKDAADSTEDKMIKGTKTATTHDYIEKPEFRLLCQYLCVYSQWLDCFRLVCDDDNKMDLSEWKTGYTKLVKDKNLPKFEGFADLGSKALDMFKRMDGDGMGAVTLEEWCKFLENAEIDAGTDIGIALDVGEHFASLDKKKVIAENKAIEAAAEAAKICINYSHQEKFLRCFSVLSESTKKGDNERYDEWPGVDPNGNGHASLAEVDLWIRRMLIREDVDLSKEIWDWYRAVYILAFQDAADSTADEMIAGTKTATTHDFVEEGEFRLLCKYLCVYGQWLDCFRVVCGGDRKMTHDEWIDPLYGYSKLMNDQKVQQRFVGLRFADGKQAEAMFTKMDDDGHGAVTLKEWCAYLENAEIEAGTDLGLALKIGDDLEHLDKKKVAAEIARQEALKSRINYEQQALFIKTFSLLAENSGYGEEERENEWGGVDSSGNGHASLAEVDLWIKRMLIRTDRKRAEYIWNHYRACYILAFKDAADSTADKRIRGMTVKQGTTHDFVEANEFRLLCKYLIVYGMMLDCFKSCSGDDTKMTFAEWEEGYPRLAHDENLPKLIGLFGLEDKQHARALFHQLDADGKGAVMLSEWCDFLEKMEVENNTDIGSDLASGDDNLSIVFQRKLKKSCRRAAAAAVAASTEVVAAADDAVKAATALAEQIAAANAAAVAAGMAQHAGAVSEQVATYCRAAGQEAKRNKNRIRAEQVRQRKLKRREIERLAAEKAIADEDEARLRAERQEREAKKARAREAASARLALEARYQLRPLTHAPGPMLTPDMPHPLYWNRRTMCKPTTEPSIFASTVKSRNLKPSKPTTPRHSRSFRGASASARRATDDDELDNNEDDSRNSPRLLRSYLPNIRIELGFFGAGGDE